MSLNTNKLNQKIVFVNQAVNFLTIDIVNSFVEKFDDISLITGNIHSQGTELSDKVNVTNITKYNHKSQISKIITWIIGSIQIYFALLFKYRKHQIFFISVPPMAYLSMLLLRNKFSLLIWDVYPDVLSIFGVSSSNPIYKFWGWANKKIFRRAFLLFTIGEKMAGLISSYVDREKIKVINLWTTFENFVPVPKSDNYFAKENNVTDKFVVQYSGNIGGGHNVEVLVETANLLREKNNIIFMLIGKGERVQKVKKKAADYDLKNFVILPFQPDNVFPYSIAAGDLGTVILDDRISHGSIPNKTYNLMTAGKPILYISSKDSELVIYREKYNNGEHFVSSDVEGIAKFISNLADDTELQKLYKKNSLSASLNFTRKNSEAIVNEYITTITNNSH